MKWSLKKGYILVRSDGTVQRCGRLIGLGIDALAVTIWPFIFIKTDTETCAVYDELIRHETIHIRQQRELLVIGALLLFMLEFLYARCVKKLDARQSYYFSCLEQEAHRNAMNPHYLKIRKPYSMLWYIKNKKHLARAQDGTLIETNFT